MDELLIKLAIAERPYRLKVRKEQEETFRKATSLINQKIKEYAENFAYKDKQDLLAMVTLQYTTDALNTEKQFTFRDKEMIDRLIEIDKVLSSNLNED